MAAELLKEYEPEIDKISLVPAEGGRFEVEVNGALLFSKLKNGRHAHSGEVLGLVSYYLKDHSNDG